LERKSPGLEFFNPGFFDPEIFICIGDRGFFHGAPEFVRTRGMENPDTSAVPFARALPGSIQEQPTAAVNQPVQLQRVFQRATQGLRQCRVPLDSLSENRRVHGQLAE